MVSFPLIISLTAVPIYGLFKVTMLSLMAPGFIIAPIYGSIPSVMNLTYIFYKKCDFSIEGIPRTQWYLEKETWTLIWEWYRYLI
jgi:hypothetical protein